MKFKRQRKEPLAVNLTPLIDVVFLLLIFFMVSTSFTDLSELVVNLPEAKGEQRQTEANGLEIVITATDDMFLNGTPFPADDKNLRLILIEKAGARRDICLFLGRHAQFRRQYGALPSVRLQPDSEPVCPRSGSTGGPERWPNPGGLAGTELSADPAPDRGCPHPGAGPGPSTPTVRAPL